MIISDVAEPTQHSTEFSLKEWASNNALLPKKSIYVASYKRPLDLLENGAKCEISVHLPFTLFQ